MVIYFTFSIESRKFVMKRELYMNFRIPVLLLKKYAKLLFQTLVKNFCRLKPKIKEAYIALNLHDDKYILVSFSCMIFIINGVNCQPPEK